MYDVDPVYGLKFIEAQKVFHRHWSSRFMMVLQEFSESRFGSKLIFVEYGK